MKDAKLQILQHSLGLNAYGEGTMFRNHFVTGSGGDFDHCRALVAEGLMTERPGNVISGGDSIFRVTPAGIDYIALNSPPRPPEPKKTRSQNRYSEYRKSGYDGSFPEYLGIST